MKRALPFAALLLAGCPLFDQGQEAPAPHELSSFRVESLGVFLPNGQPLNVGAECLAQYGTQTDVPNEVRGTAGCPYIIPPTEVHLRIRAQARHLSGTDMAVTKPVSFRVVPGELTTDQRARWEMMNDGVVEAEVRALHLYGEARVWVEDQPPRLVSAGVDASQLPDEGLAAPRTYATGASPIIYFEDQTLQTLQNPGLLDNRISPFTGEYVVVGKGPNTGQRLRQSCAADPQRNGADALMVVTGLDPTGFFVTDISACRLEEPTSDALGESVRSENLEPRELCLNDDGAPPTDGGLGRCQLSRRPCTTQVSCLRYLPGTYGSMFVYNYNFPDGLDRGDLLFTLAGGVQEFSGTTQLVFPSWLTAERVRFLPEEEWDKWIKFVTPYDIGGRTCGQDNVREPYFVDQLCGHNRRNMKMESLESTLVRIRHVRFPRRFVSCDFNANGEVPFFCENPPTRSWGACGDSESAEDALERTCNQDCTLGIGQFAGELCSERTNYEGFGQFVVELPGAGPEAWGLDPQLPMRQPVAFAPADGGTPVESRITMYPLAEFDVRCDSNARWRIGTNAVRAGPDDPVIAKDEVVRFKLDADGGTAIAFQAAGRQDTRCHISVHAHTRINVVTRDAIPDINPDCDIDDSNEVEAVRCRALRGATFDVVGHLRHVQAARPRWSVLPRDADDLCCYPGPGLECPQPIKPCPRQSSGEPEP